MTQLNATADDTDFDRTTAMRANQERPGEFAPGWSVGTVSTGFLRTGTEPPTREMSIGVTVHIHRSGFASHPGDWLAGAFEIDDSTACLAVEHGRLPQMDGTVVAESSQTRLTAQV